MKHWGNLEIFSLPFHKPLIINCFKLSQLAIKTMQSHYCPWCTCQLGIFFLALWWLILTPGHNENCQKVTKKVYISHPDNFDPYIMIAVKTIAAHLKNKFLYASGYFENIYLDNYLGYYFLDFFYCYFSLNKNFKFCI